MDDEQRERALAWFRGRIPPACPSCQRASAFDVLDTIVSPNAMLGQEIMVGGPPVPLVGLVCQNCANVRWFSAVMMGMVLETEASIG